MGNDTWKWALVLVLSAIFILVAHSAYKSLHSADDRFPPPDDYLKGDSFDLEQGNTPGPVGGVPIDGVEAPVASETAQTTTPPPQPGEAVPASLTRHDTSDWDTLTASGTQ